MSKHRQKRTMTAKSACLMSGVCLIALVGAYSQAGPGVSVGPYDPRSTPLGLPTLEIPADNPITQEKIELGKMLFFDPRLSANGAISCASCHNPQQGWAERRPTSKGIDGQIGTRNAPSIVNAAYQRKHFWDGRSPSLEDQALGPIENPIEMGQDLAELVQRLSTIPEYDERFNAAFGTGVTREAIGKAIATFERTILSGDSPYDKYDAGDLSALTKSQVRGMNVFMVKADCAMCHRPPTFSNGRFYNAGVDAGKNSPDAGRKNVTEREKDFGRFRVPSLREVEHTGPYFHDGSAKTLADAVALMAAGGIDNPHRSSAFDVVRDAELTDQDNVDLVEFLKSLSGTFPIIDPPSLP